jgi:hypothetical protein
MTPDAARSTWTLDERDQLFDFFEGAAVELKLN